MVDDLLGRLDRDGVLGVSHVYAGQLLAAIRDLDHGLAGLQTSQVILAPLHELINDCLETLADIALPLVWRQ